MIRELFIPQEVKNYYIVPTRIIGFDIGKTQVTATQVLAKGRKVFVEKWYQEQLDTDLATDYDARVSAAIKKIIDSVDAKYQAIYSSISNTQAIFKELKFPFTETEMISRVVHHEIEPLLPFPIEDAVIDFVITKIVKEEKSAEVLIAAVQKQHIAHHLALFEAAGVNPERVTIDLFALYGLYHELYRNNQTDVIITEVGIQSTRMAYIQQGQLRSMRTLPKGIFDVARVASDELDISFSDALNYVMRYGLEKHATIDNYTQAIAKGFASLAQDMQFTINSFTSHNPTAVDSVIFFGQTVHIKGMLDYFSHQFQLPSSIFTLENSAKTSIVLHKKNIIPQENIASLAVALPSTITGSFNLRKKEFGTESPWLISRQLLTSALLALAIIGSLVAYNFLTLRTLHNEAYSSQEEVIETLRERFPKIPDDINDLDDIIAEAQRAVNDEEKRFAVLTTARTSYLKYLLELTDKIDKQALDLDLEKITISSDRILTLQGRVKDYEALKNLERDLKKSKLFKLIEEGKEPQFTIVIRLLGNGQEKS